jgi:hypothetical protein
VKDEEMLKLLGEVAREHQDSPLDSRWEALVRGELSQQEQDALFDDEGLERAQIAPLGQDFDDKMAAKLLAMNRPVRRTWLRLAPVLAMAAALLLWVAVPTGPTALPDYEMVVRGGNQVVRSVDEAVTGPRVLGPGAQLEVLLRPETPSESPVACSAWFVRSSGQLAPWTGDLAISPSGAVRLAGVVGETLKLVPGPQDLLIVLHPASADNVRETVLAGLDGQPSPWATWTIALMVQAP